METAYKFLIKQLEGREVYTDEMNEKEINNILERRAVLYTAIECLPNYEELMSSNNSFKTTGNLYNFKGFKSFDTNIQSLARIYERSKDAFIKSNIGIILEQVDFIDEYDFMDRFQEASIYFQKSFNTFEPGDVKFITYAYSYVKWGIINSFKKDNPVKYRDNVRYIFNRIKELRVKLAPQQVNLSIVKEHYPEFDYEDIEAAFTFESPLVSLNSNLGMDGSKAIELIDAIEDDNVIDIDDEIDKDILTKKIKEVISNERFFKERDRKILTMRFGIELPDEYTLEEVGQQFGITRERVRQLESKAISLLKNKYSIELQPFY